MVGWISRCLSLGGVEVGIRLRLIKLGLFLYGFLLFALLCSVSLFYIQGGLTGSQYIAFIYLIVALIAIYAYLLTQWRN